MNLQMVVTTALVGLIAGWLAGKVIKAGVASAGGRVMNFTMSRRRFSSNGAVCALWNTN